MTAPASPAAEVYDRTGRAIMIGDVLKVFHFIGARWRKHYYMYKQVTGERKFDDGTVLLEVSHLALKQYGEKDSGYTIAKNGSMLSDVEIVQGLDWHHDRPRSSFKDNPHA